MNAYRFRQFGFGFVAGYCDTVGFIALGGLFVAHVTGNMVLAGASLFSTGAPNTIPGLLMLPVFVLAIGGLTLACRTEAFERLKQTGKTRALLSFQLAATIAFWFVGAVFSASEHPIRTQHLVFVVGATGVVAFAAQNALTRLVGSSAPATTVMTGNLTQAAVSTFTLLSNWIRRMAGDSEREVMQLKSLAPGVAGFFVGAASGAPLAYYFGFQSMALACAVLALLIYKPGPVRGRPG